MKARVLAAVAIACLTSAPVAAAAQPPSPNPAASAAGFQQREMKRLLGVARTLHGQHQAYRLALPGQPDTAVLVGRQAPYTWSDLEAGQGVVRRTKAGLPELVEPLVVGPGATLRLDLKAGPEVLLRSDSDVTASIVNDGGVVDIIGSSGQRLTLASYDDKAGGIDSSIEDGRAYVLTIGGKTTLQHVAVDGLGAADGETSGLTWFRRASTQAVAALQDVVVTNGFTGAELVGTSGGRLDRVAVEDPVDRGIVLHRASAVRLNEVSVDSPGSEGIVCIDAHDVIATQTTVTSAPHLGWWLLRSGDVRLDGGTSTGDRVGIRISGRGSTNDVINGVRLLDDQSRGVELQAGARDTVISATQVSGDARGLIGLWVQSAPGTRLIADTVRARHPVRTDGASIVQVTNTQLDEVVSGRHPHTRRVTVPLSSSGYFARHPMVAVWFLMIALPLLAALLVWTSRGVSRTGRALQRLAQPAPGTVTD